MYNTAGQEAAIPRDTDSFDVWDAITTRKRSPRKEIILNIGEQEVKLTTIFTLL